MLWGPRQSRFFERVTRPLPHPMALALLACTSAGGVWIYARYVGAIYPLRDWLAWPVLALWAYTALCNLAWFSAGSWLTGRLLGGRELPHLERAVLGTVVGIVLFTELMYLAGALGLYGPWFSVVFALLLSLAGAPELWRWWRAYRESPAPAAQPAGLLLLALWGVGAALTAWLYLGLFSPDAVNYDASWCHLTVPQDYAREGRIVAFPGDYNKNQPQLAALLRTWVFSVPGLKHAALRWMLALHQEFSVFLWTLAGVAAGVRYLLRDPALRGSWVAFYLFPVIFVYDHNLGGALDHIAAVFCVPGLVAAGRLLERLEWRRGLAMVVCMSGGLLAKYQSFYWLVPVLVVVALGWALRLLPLVRLPASRAPERRALGFLPVVLAGALLLLVSPHFLRNWIFYRDPLYPFAQSLFSYARPQVDDAAFLVSNTFIDRRYVPTGTLLEQLRFAVKLAFTFSFEPHYSFANNVPMFGSLFTLLLPGLLCLRERRRLWFAAFVGSCTLVLWGFTTFVDRNLQVFLPILVVAAAAILIGILRLGWIARGLLAPLVLFQIVWGADAIFYSSAPRISAAMELIASGFNGAAETRFAGYRAPYLAMQEVLPQEAKVLLHMAHGSLGVDRELVLDAAGFQGLISYSQVHGPRELAQLYRGLGISHLLYTPGQARDSTLQGEVAFQSLVRWIGSPIKEAGGLRLLRLPEELPPVEPPYRVLTLEVAGYGSGVFPIERLGTVDALPADLLRYARAEAPVPVDGPGLLALNVDAVVVGAAAPLDKLQNKFLARGFALVARYPSCSVCLRLASAAEGG